MSSKLMRTNLVTYSILLFLCTFSIVCFAVDGVMFNLDKFLSVVHGFPQGFWSKTICVALIGTTGSLLLVAKKHPRLAALAIACWWIPTAMAVSTLCSALIYQSPNQVAVIVGSVAALGLCVSACLLIGQLSVTISQCLRQVAARSRAANA